MIINVVPIIISLMLAIFLSVKTKVSSALDFFLVFLKYHSNNSDWQVFLGKKEVVDTVIKPNIILQ